MTGDDYQGLVQALDNAGEELLAADLRAAIDLPSSSSSEILHAILEVLKRVKATPIYRRPEIASRIDPVIRDVKKRLWPVLWWLR